MKLDGPINTEIPCPHCGCTFNPHQLPRSCQCGYKFLQHIVNLPPEILLKIVTCLDPISLARCRGTCKALGWFIPPFLSMNLDPQISITTRKLEPEILLAEEGFIPSNFVPQCATTIELGNEILLAEGGFIIRNSFFFGLFSYRDVWIRITYKNRITKKTGECCYVVSTEKSRCEQIVAHRIENDRIVLFLLMSSGQLFKIIRDNDGKLHVKEVMEYRGVLFIDKIPPIAGKSPENCDQILIITKWLIYYLKGTKNKPQKNIQAQLTQRQPLPIFTRMTHIGNLLFCIYGYKGRSSLYTVDLRSGETLNVTTQAHRTKVTAITNITIGNMVIVFTGSAAGNICGWTTQYGKCIFKIKVDSLPIRKLSCRLLSRSSGNIYHVQLISSVSPKNEKRLSLFFSGVYC